VTPLVSLREALSDPQLLGTTLAGDSWRAWRVLLTAACGEALTDDERTLFAQLTGREREPGKRVNELVCVVGRRGGKSRALATLACYVAALCQHRLAPGERGVVLIVAQSSHTARVILGYARAVLEASPLLRTLVVADNSDAIELRNGVVLEVRWASFRVLRGPTYVAALLDEAAFLWTDEFAANPDVEVVNALRPGLTGGGPLIVASSPYARRGWLWDAYRKHFGAGGAPAVLVAKGTTRDFNPTIPQAWVDAELERDPARNRAEYLAEFRSDIESYIAREAVEACVAWDVPERAPMSQTRYYAFVDPSGGSADSMTLAIGHRDRDNDLVVLDALRERRPPFSPEAVVAEFCELLRFYRVSKVTGDRYAGEWPRERFKEHGITYEPAQKTKSDLYRDLLPLVNSRRIDLLDDARLLAQLCNLERRTARGTGKDNIDHAPGGHDDLANALAGVAATAKRGSYPTDLSWVSGPGPAEGGPSPADEFLQRRFAQHVLASSGFYRRRW
jgi:hypothetical protein